MNLSNLNLNELSLEEAKTIEGGFPPVVLAAWGVMAAIDVGLITLYAMYDSNGKLKHK